MPITPLQDFDMSPFECARKLLDGSQASLGLGAKMDLVFQDMDLVPLLIQENYVNHKPNLGVAEEQHMRVRQPVLQDASDLHPLPASRQEGCNVVCLPLQLVGCDVTFQMVR